jgi:hypothetical protein
VFAFRLLATSLFVSSFLSNKNSDFTHAWFEVAPPHSGSRWARTHLEAPFSSRDTHYHRLASIRINVLGWYPVASERREGINRKVKE